MPRTKVFISYSHRDADWLARLQVHLKPLQRQNLLDLWDDTKIAPGGRWRDEIHRALASARVAVLLVSKYYLASDFVFEVELPHLLEAAAEGGTVILPVILAPCRFHETPILSGFQAVGSPDRTLADLSEPEQERAWLQLIDAIDAALARSVLVSAANGDAALARDLGAGLAARRFSVDLHLWTDAEDRSLHERVGASRSTLLLCGADGTGPWTATSLRSVRAGGRPAVAILLPGCAHLPPLAASLPRTAHRRWTHDLDRTPTLDWLEQALTGELKTTPAAEPAEAPAAPSRPATATSDPLASAIERLAPLLDEHHLTIFLGPGAYPDDERYPPRPFEITRELLSHLEVLDAELEAPAFLPSLEVASSYFVVCSGERHLEHTVGELLSRSHEVPPVCRQIAELLRQLGEKPTPLRRLAPQHLVITTGLDLFLERALLEAGVSFTRLVQHGSGHRIDINEYREVTRVGDRAIHLETGHGVETVRLDELSETIAYSGRCTVERVAGAGDGATNTLHALPLGRWKSPYVFKFFGSSDVVSSTTISAEEHLRLVAELAAHHIVPAKIHEILAGGPVVFLGHDLLDPPLRLAWSAFSTELLASATQPRFAVQLPPSEEPGDGDRRLELGSWEEIKARELKSFAIEVVEERSEVFLAHLCERLAR